MMVLRRTFDILITSHGDVNIVGHDETGAEIVVRIESDHE